MSDGGQLLASPSGRLALGLALGLLLLVAWVLLRGRGARWLFAAAFLPPPLIALFSRQFDFVGWHAFMHASPIYQIMAHGGAPEDPLYAGGALRYPWAEFWLTATAARWTGANPLLLTLIAQTLAYLVFIAAAAWLASSLTDDPVTIGLAALLSAFGISIFHAGPLAEPMQRAFSVWLETRVVPLDKFLSVTAMPIGYAAMLLASAAGVELVARDEENRLRFAWIAAGTLVAVFIHPLSWLGILVIEGVVGVVLLVARPPGVWRRVLGLVLAVGIPSSVALPYLRSVGTSESSQGSIGITRSFALLSDKAADLGFFLAVFLLLAYVERAQLLQRLRERHRATIVLLASIGSWSVAYLTVSAPGRNEYKFLLQLAPPAAAFLAIWLRSLLLRHRELALGLLFLLLLPGAQMLGIRPWFAVTDPARIVGQYQRALDPATDELYQWVANQTPSDAVFIAADLRMPPLGRRSLYVAVDAPWVGRDGWGLPRNSLLQWHVRRPDREMYRRQRLATIVLSPDWSSPADDVMREIEAAVPARTLYVHSWSRSVSAKLDATRGFVRRFGNGAGSIYQWLGMNGIAAMQPEPAPQLAVRPPAP